MKKAAPKKLKPFLISVYAKLVILGKYTLDETVANDDIKLVPAAYQEAVSEWLVKYYNKG